MLWAVYCTAILGFLRSGEVTVPSRATYDPDEHLSYGDISFNSQAQQTVAQVNIIASKMDPFQAGVMIYLGRTNCELCSLTALVAYYSMLGTEAGPFFQFRDGSPLSTAVKLQARQLRGDAYKSYHESASRVSKAVSEMHSNSTNTTITHKFLTGRVSSWQAHLKPITQFLKPGIGGWRKKQK